VHDVGVAALGELVEVAVHGCQADPIAPAAKFGEQILRGPESVGVSQGSLDRGRLAGIAKSPSGPAGRRIYRVVLGSHPSHINNCR
jgi:hypothetical protein